MEGRIRNLATTFLFLYAMNLRYPEVVTLQGSHRLTPELNYIVNKV